MTERAEDVLHKVKLTTLVVLPFLAAILATTLLWRRYVFPGDLLLFAVMYFLTEMGVTIGFHRMLTHQGFQAPAALRAFFLICGCMSFETSPATWAAMHIKHHAHSDEEDDPHSPLHGFWHAHFGWLFNVRNYLDPERYAPHLLEDPAVAWVSRTWCVWAFLGLLIPAVLGGWTGFLWGGLVRLFMVSHVTYSVNSICHCFGRRDFETTDESRNNWVVGLLAFGEGWHNNHHAFPSNAFHGMQWWQLDLSGLIIRALEKLGVVWNVERVSTETMEAHRVHALRARERLTALRSELAARVALAKRELAEMMEKPFSSTLKPGNVAELSATCSAALARLETIQKNVARATNVKKQRLLAYQREIAELVERVKQRLPQRVAA